MMLAADPVLPLWVTLAVGIAGGTATLLVAMAGAWAKTNAARRRTYAEAVRAVIAWAEYPYQVRRRTSDGVEELARLRDLGHRLQGDLEYHRALLAAESPTLGNLYGEIVAGVKGACGDWIADAWAQPPIQKPTEMVLGDWGPGSFVAEVDRLRVTIGRRFGWRRFWHWLRAE